MTKRAFGSREFACNATDVGSFSGPCSRRAEPIERFAELLSAVAEKLSLAASPSSQGVLKLYERWLRTGSDELGSELLERGVLPVRGSGGLH